MQKLECDKKGKESTVEEEPVAVTSARPTAQIDSGSNEDGLNAPSTSNDDSGDGSAQTNEKGDAKKTKRISKSHRG